MAVVAEFDTSKGVHIKILDDAIAGVSEDEMQRRIREAQVTAWRIAEAKARRERGTPISALRATSPQEETRKQKED